MSQSDTDTLFERTLACRTVFSGRALTVDVLDIALPDGRRSVREVVRHGGAVVVLAERPDGRFVLVRQMRKAIEEVLLEAVAGCVDPGELPPDAAVRELQEETGYRSETLTPLGTIVPCPGYSAERLHLFHARVATEATATDFDFDENLRVEVMTPEAIETAIDDGTLKDAKTLTIWYLWQRRQRRRRDGGGS